jgi:hypothetical protein
MNLGGWAAATLHPQLDTSFPAAMPALSEPRASSPAGTADGGWSQLDRTECLSVRLPPNGSQIRSTLSAARRAPLPRPSRTGLQGGRQGGRRRTPTRPKCLSTPGRPTSPTRIRCASDSPASRGISVAEKSTSVGPQAVGSSRRPMDYAHAHAWIVFIGRPPRSRRRRGLDLRRPRATPAPRV